MNRRIENHVRWAVPAIIAYLYVAAPFAWPQEYWRLDLTKAEEAKTKAIWSHRDKIQITKDGLGSDAGYDFWLQTTEPIALGEAWKPVHFVDVNVGIHPPGKFQSEGGTTIFPPGEMYVRFSPDAKHWSTWQCLERPCPKEMKNAPQTYHGFIRVPYREEEHYKELVSQFASLYPESKFDEEAAVKWIIKKDPAFFEKTIPFIGYIQFLLETSLSGSQRIKAIQIESYCQEVDNGIVSVEYEQWTRGRHGPWRFKAP